MPRQISEPGPRGGTAVRRNTCECGGPKTATAATCKKCMDDRRRTLNHNCVDCGKRVAKGAQRCRAHRDIHSRGANHPRWKGGRYVGKDGYVYLNGNHLDDPRFAGRHQVAEHTVVMETILGRPLRKGESVHHKNGIRQDNAPSNLELWVKSQPAGQRVVDVLAWAHEVIERYETEALRIFSHG